MNREYHTWYSSRLGREMELLVFGHAGLPMLAFPTSGGRFYELEDCGMISALADRIDAGQAHLFCVDSVNLESWYYYRLPPRLRIARQMCYEAYLLNAAVPFVREKNHDPRLLVLGCSFGRYHAVNIALRPPGIFAVFFRSEGPSICRDSSTAITTRIAPSTGTNDSVLGIVASRGEDRRPSWA
jgi:esterase/lipase superfamily enzyme